MFESESTPFSMPVMPAGNNSGGMFGGDGWWAIIIFAIIFGWGGFGGFGGNRANSNSGALDNYVLAFATLQRQIDSAAADLKTATTSIGNGICSLGYDQLGQINGVNQNISNVGYNLQNAITTNGYETKSAIQADTVTNMQNANALQSQIASCCCENKQAIAELNYNLATQGCATKQAIADSTKQIIDFLTQDKIATLTAENQNLKFAQSQTAQNGLLTGALAAQTSQLINAINPTPVPAYVVQNPNGCGCGCGYAYN